MSGLRRYWISSRQAAREAWPQDVSATVQGMRWQGTDTKGGQLRRPHLRCENYAASSSSIEFRSRTDRFFPAWRDREALPVFHVERCNDRIRQPSFPALARGKRP
jgi:hypothetical protein